MANKFEDLKSWQVARELNKNIHNIISNPLWKSDKPLKDQLNRSAASIMDNIAEGYGRNGSKEFIQFLSCSKGSCVEIKSQLYRALDRNYIDENLFHEVYDRVDQIEKMNTNLMSYLKKSEKKGWKKE